MLSLNYCITFTPLNISFIKHFWSSISKFHFSTLDSSSFNQTFNNLTSVSICNMLLFILLSYYLVPNVSQASFLSSLFSRGKLFQPINFSRKTDSSIRRTESKGGWDFLSYGPHGMNVGGCKCDCDDEDEGGVRLMAVEKIIKVPKIKVHDFGKKGDWNVAGKSDHMDLTKGETGGNSYMMMADKIDAPSEQQTSSSEKWEVAGKYDTSSSNWDFDGQNNLGLGFAST